MKRIRKYNMLPAHGQNGRWKRQLRAMLAAMEHVEVEAKRALSEGWHMRSLQEQADGSFNIKAYHFTGTALDLSRKRKQRTDMVVWGFPHRWRGHRTTYNSAKVKRWIRSLLFTEDVLELVLTRGVAIQKEGGK